MFEKLTLYLQYPFVRYALIVGVLIALCSSLLGVTLVLKRYSFIGDGLSHVAFGAMAIAAVLNLANNMLLVLPVTVISAVLLLRTGQNAKIKGDAAIAMVSVGALAFGYLIMNIFSTSSNLSGDVCSTLFGSTSILTLSLWEVWLCAVLSVLVVLIFILFYNKIFAVTFDEDFSTAAGTKVNAYKPAFTVDCPAFMRITIKKYWNEWKKNRIFIFFLSMTSGLRQVNSQNSSHQDGGTKMKEKTKEIPVWKERKRFSGRLIFHGKPI